MPDITEDIVKHVAHLSRIALHDGEAKKYATHLGTILEYVDQLTKIDTTTTEPLLQVSGLKNVLREDAITNKNRREELLSVVPESENGLLKVRVVK